MPGDRQSGPEGAVQGVVPQELLHLRFRDVGAVLFQKFVDLFGAQIVLQQRRHRLDLAVISVAGQAERLVLIAGLRQLFLDLADLLL